jgi:hypothetical protein
MSWAGISVVWKRPGQTDDEVYVEQFGELDSDDGPQLPLPPATASQLASAGKAVEMMAAMGLTVERESEYVACFDEYTNVTISGHGCDVVPTRYSRPDGQFRRMWQQVCMFAELEDSFVVDPEPEVCVIDTRLSAEEAFEAYGWCAW